MSGFCRVLVTRARLVLAVPLDSRAVAMTNPYG